MSNARSSTPFVDLGAQRTALADALEEAWRTALHRGDHILGEDVVEFEKEFAAYCGVAHAIGVDSGTSALELSLRALRIGEGDEVITAANTFIATAFAISHTGATPVLVDIDPQTYTLDPTLLSAAIGPRTRAIIPVHLYGQPADMTPIRELARARGIAVIEDACQAHGARYGERRAGSLGDVAAFSFYPTKNLGAHGDGGIVVTDDETIAERVRLLRSYGERQKRRSEEIGFNRRLDTLQAAMLRVKLPYLDAWNEARSRHARRFTELLAGAAVVTPKIRPGCSSAWHLYVVRVRDRDGVQERLQREGIETAIHYPLPVHLHPAYHQLRHVPGDFPVTEGFAQQLLSLPLYPELPDAAVDQVAAALRDCVGPAENGEPTHAAAGDETTVR